MISQCYCNTAHHESRVRHPLDATGRRDEEPLAFESDNECFTRLVLRIFNFGWALRCVGKGFDRALRITESFCYICSCVWYHALTSRIHLEGQSTLLGAR